MGLPLHIGRLSFFQCPSESSKSRLYAVVIPNPEQGSFNAQIVDPKGNLYLQVSDYRTVAVPDGIDPERMQALRSAMSLQPVSA
jgi:hypothetical protein